MISTSFGNDYNSKNPPNTRKVEPMLNFIVIVNSPAKKTLFSKSMEFLLKLAPGVKIWKIQNYRVKIW